MKLWTPDTDTSAVGEHARARLAEAEQRVALWGRRIEYARKYQAAWEERVRQYKNRLGIE